MPNASDSCDPLHHPPAPGGGGVAARSYRLVAAIIFAASFGVLFVAWLLTPSAAGYGTHTQMGLPECGFRFSTGLPCPTCGMTTAFSHAANGDLLTSMTTQPAGALLALLTAVTAIVAGYALLTGMSLGPIAQAVMRPSILLLLGLALLAGWGYTLGGALGYW